MKKRYQIEDPVELTGYPVENQVYKFRAGEVLFWGVFTPTEGMDDEEAAILREACGTTVDDKTTTFKFDRLSNIEASWEGKGALYSRLEKPKMTLPQLNAVGEAVAKCFELHHQSTGTQQYYALAVDNNLTSFYTRLAKKHGKALGFQVFSEVGSGNLGYVFRKEV